ncbi:MAG: tetratricopeptide repeat protein [Geitlerinemataceae cyanobacterium]
MSEAIVLDTKTNGKKTNPDIGETRIVLQPNLSQSHYHLGQVLAKQEEWEDAIVAYRQALDIKPNGEIYFSLAEALVKQDKEVEAIEAYQKAIEKQPNLARGYHNLGDLLQKQRRLEEAIEAYQKAIEFDPNFSWSHNNLGDVFRDLERWEEAIEVYKKAIDLNPNFAWSHYNLAEAAMKQQNWEKAIVAYRAADKLEADLPDFKSKLGKALQNQSSKNLQESIQLYAEQIAKNPGNIDLYHSALELEPHNAQLYLGLGKVLEEKGEINQSIVFYNIALQQDPDCAEEVLAAYSRLMQSDLDAPALKRKLSEAYANVSHVCMQKARTSYRQALRLDPENPQLDRSQLDDILKLEPDILGFEDSAIASQAHLIDFYPQPQNCSCDNQLVSSKAKYKLRFPKSKILVDIIVCVHNALEDVKKCLDSIVRNTTIDYQIVIIDDGSESDTSDFLIQWVNRSKNMTLIRNSIAKGYTKAANQGLQASRSDYVLLLNSDTIVTPKWIEKLIECAKSDLKIGVVGPLSNCASWQSVPDLFDANGDWAINQIPKKYSLDGYSQLIEQSSQRSFPSVSFINGFCYMITRAALDSVGLLDEESFPHGYGEENDFSLRIMKAGFKLAIADHTYIYHAKSKSFGHQRRKELAKQGSSTLKEKYPDVDFKALTAQIKDDRNLENLRKFLKENATE